MAYGTQTGNGGYDDSTAVLSGAWASDQSVQAIVVVRGGTSNIAEVELRLRTSISPGRITGYEFNFSIASGQVYAQIVRWNGSLGSFTLLDSRGIVVHSGDLVAATAVGNTLTLYVNGTARFSVKDSTFKNGSPGIGFYVTPGGLNQNFGLTNFSASDSGGIDWSQPQRLRSRRRRLVQPGTLGKRNCLIRLIPGLGGILRFRTKYENRKSE